MATQDQQTEVPDERDWSAAAAELFGPEGPFAAYARSVDARAMFEQGMDLYKSMFEIALGKSKIAPDPRDWRFQDEAWTSNPFYKRLSQAYLAMTDAVEEMIPEELP